MYEHMEGGDLVISPHQDVDDVQTSGQWLKGEPVEVRA